MRPWTIILFSAYGTHVEMADAPFDAAEALKQIQTNIQKRNEDLAVLAILPGMFKDRVTIASPP